MVQIESDTLSLVPGPAQFDEPLYSTEVQEMLEYAAPDIARSLDDLLGPRDIDGGDDWYAHRWRWSRGDRFIVVSFTTMAEDRNPVLWGGSPLKLRCNSDDLLELWGQLRKRHEAVWLHDDDCRIYTPRSFELEFLD